MVSEMARWVLVNTKVDPLEVANAWGISESECWDYISDYTDALREAEEKREPLTIQEEMRSWVDIIPNKNNIKIAVIKEKLIDAKTYPDKYDVEKLLMEVKVLTGRVEQITPQDIARAKEHPIQHLVKTTGRRGNVSCPFHKDKTPSFQIKKNNTFTCYSCGEYGDVIDLYQKLNNVSFLQAVEALKT